MRRLIFSMTILAIATPIASAQAQAGANQESRKVTERELDNLVAFSKLLGYVRHFHPSDEAAAANWDIVTIEGIDAVEKAENAGDLADRERCLAGGMDGYVSKPIQTAALFQEINEAMADWGQQTSEPACWRGCMTGMLPSFRKPVRRRSIHPFAGIGSGERLTIVRVDKEAKEKLQPGDVVLKIDGQAVQKLMDQRCEQMGAESPNLKRRMGMMLAAADKKPSDMELEVQTGEMPVRKVTLKRSLGVPEFRNLATVH